MSFLLSARRYAGGEASFLLEEFGLREMDPAREALVAGQLGIFLSRDQSD